MIFKRDKSAYWYYDFTLAGDRYRGSTKEKTKNAAQAYEAALRTRISERGPSARPKKAPQFREFVPAFRGFIKHHTGLSPKSKAYYEDGIGLLLNSSVASMRLDHIKKSHIQTLQLPGSASWQNCALRTLRRMLAIAKEWGLLWEVPTVPLLEQRQRRDVFDQEVEIQIAAKARQPLQDVFVTMMDTGCRPGEVLALRWEDILWDLGVIFVRQGKTKKSIRYVPMSDRVRDRLAVRVEASGRTGYVFPSTRSKAKHVTLSCLSKEFRRVRDLLGLSRDLVLYTARHSFATGLLDMTGNIKLVADTLGHADTKITGTYLHPSSGGLSSLINERNARNARRISESAAHFTAHSPSEDSCGVPQGPHGMLSQVAVSGQLKVSK